MYIDQFKSSEAAQRSLISFVKDELNWVEILVTSLEEALGFWDPLLTGAGYVGCQSWDWGRSYALGTNRVLIIQLDAADWQLNAEAAGTHMLSQRREHQISSFKDITTRLLEAGL